MMTMAAVPQTDPAPPVATNIDAPCVVAVRALCEFTAKQGDLDRRFTPSPTAQQGIAGHLLVASKRSADYQSEISLSGQYRHLNVRGRADGYDPRLKRLEEIKTFRGDLDRMPGNHRALHWAQVKVYGWMFCTQNNLLEVTLALVYFDIVSQQETVLSESHTAASLQIFFEQHCARYLAWSAQEQAHRQLRDAACTALAFPYPTFRTGQRELAQAVYQGARSGRCVLAQAPTGIGKTVGSIFPMLKAMPSQQLDKIFYLAAKTSGRQLALDAIALIRNRASLSPFPLPLRVIELVAREKACEYPDKACHGESCPLARGFYDRLPAARGDAALLSSGDHQSIRKVALSHQICPYFLGQEMVRWSDVVVGDYNYYFDTSAMLYALTVANQWQIGVLVDEAHNMIERSRAMYSAELDRHSLTALCRHTSPPLRAPLSRLQRQWTALVAEHGASYQTLPVLPEKWLGALQRAATAIGDYFTEQPSQIDPALQRFFFDASHFLRLVETFDLHSLIDLTVQESTQATLCLRNVVPAPFLAERFKVARSTALFSATLSPWHFYSDTLGLPADTGWIDVASPFSAEQLQVHLVTSISTRYQDRPRSLSPIIDLMAQQYARRPGNYLTFFSSFDYLQQVTALFAERYPTVPIWSQVRGMNEPEREQFLARFCPGGAGIGFAVLGGAFSEGIDLPGDRLVGAFIATLGLPQVNPVNEQMRQRMELQYGDGYRATYLFPGLQKVVQAAGRVIRSQSDQGVLFLIDDRYHRSEVRTLLPRWWAIMPRSDTTD